MTDLLTILQGDCREVLKTLPDESVQCVVTSPPLNLSVIQCFASCINPVSVGQNARVHHSLCWTASFSCSWVLFTFPKQEQTFYVWPFNDYKRQQDFGYLRGQCVRRLPAKQRSPRHSLVAGFSVITSSKSSSQKSNRRLVNHTHLKPLVINKTYGVFSSCSLYSNISLSVDKPCQVSNLVHSTILTHPQYAWQHNEKGGKV